MIKESFWKSPAVKGVKHGLVAMLFSYLPTLISFLIQWASTNVMPGFYFVFDHGNMISIWIPILAMLLIALYEISENRNRYLGEEVSFVIAIIILVLSVVFYLCFHYGFIQYARWVKVVSLIIVFLLFLLLSYSKYLEYSEHDDLQRTRAKEQDILDEKVSKMK